MSLTITIDSDRLEALIKQALLDQDAATYHCDSALTATERAKRTASTIVAAARLRMSSDEAIELLKQRLSSE